MFSIEYMVKTKTFHTIKTPAKINEEGKIIENEILKEHPEKVYHGVIKSKTKRTKKVQIKIALNIWKTHKNAALYVPNIVGMKTLITRLR